MGPELTTHPLTRADGSATFSNTLFTILAAVNGPIEVQRRDELPEEAAIEVNIRPASGVGGPRERWLESVIAAHKENTQQCSQLAKKMIDFLNSKSSQELRTMQV